MFDATGIKSSAIFDLVPVLVFIRVIRGSKTVLNALHFYSGPIPV